MSLARWTCRAGVAMPQCGPTTRSPPARAAKARLVTATQSERSDEAQPEGGDARFLSPQRELTAWRHLNARRERDLFQHGAGDHQVVAHALRVLLEARRRVEDVAHEDDLPSQVAELTRRDGASMQPAAECRHHTEIALVAGGIAPDGRADLEEAADAAGFQQAGHHRPGDDDLVARVLVDLSAGLEHRLRQIVHKAAEQLEVAGAAEPQIGRAH